jgi:hypothetical protein
MMNDTETEATPEEEFESKLLELLVEVGESEDFDVNPMFVRTFEQAGLLTRNRGLVVRTADGSREFQLIVQSV